MEEHLKIVRLILYPFMIFSLAIYACLYLVSPIGLAFQAALILGALITILIFRLEKINWSALFHRLFDWENLLLFVPVIFITLVFGFVLAPLVKHKIVDGQEVLGLTALGDYYKHLYMLATIKTGGLPPHHPFFPSAGLSYYYSYYLIPSAISSVFSVDLVRVFFFYILTTTFVILVTIIQISRALFQKWYQILLALILFIFGTSLDIIPTLILAKSGQMTANHIEFWSQILNLSNYLVNNIYTVLLWVPQHSITSLVVLTTGIFLIKEKKVSIFWLILAIWFSVTSSTFVSVSLIIWLVLSFLFIKKSRPRLLISGVSAILLLFPYLDGLADRGSLLSFGFYMTPFPYLSTFPYWVNAGLTFFTEYGLIIIAIPAFMFSEYRKNRTQTLLISFAVSLPILIGLFVKSSGFNDFSMRSILPSQMALPLLVSVCIKDIGRSAWKKLFLLLLTISLIPAMTGFFYEIHFRLIDRGLIDPRTSELLLSLRKNPVPNLAVINNDNWAFLIPSYGYQSIYSPTLFDSSGYISSSSGVAQLEYREQVNKLFINQTIGKDYSEVMRTKLEDIKGVNKFFNDHSAYNFLLPKHRGSKSALDPWNKFMELSGVKPSKVTSSFYLYKGESVKDVLDHTRIEVPSKPIILTDVYAKNGLYLKAGLWFVVVCGGESSTSLKLEFSGYYNIINQNFEAGKKVCAGDIYYQPKEEKVMMTETSQFKEIYLTKLNIKKY